MSKKTPRNERRKRAEAAAAEAAPPTLTPAQIFRKRRNRRLIFIAVIAVLLPLLEVIAYRNRSILITVVNRSDELVTKLKVTYPGGSIEAKELKPGGELTQLARPDYSFTRNEFSTYRTAITFSTADGGVIRQFGRSGTIDYSARETHTIQAEGMTQTVPERTTPSIVIKHTTSPGFPLGAVRDLLKRLGVG